LSVLLACFWLGAPPADAQRWVRLGFAPTPRDWLSVAVTGGRIYAIGGRRPFEDGAEATVDVYDPRQDDWSEAPLMPEGIAGAAAVALHGDIYVLGGWRPPFFATPFVDVYQVRRNRWIRGADMRAVRAGRYGTTASAVGGRIYAIGGYDRGEYLGVVEEYSPRQDTWTRKADMPTPRFQAVSAAVGGRIYVIGGGTAGPPPPPNAKAATVEEYEPETDTWRSRQDMPTARHAAAVAAVGGLIYVMGGVENGVRFSSAVEVYDPVTDDWDRLDDLPLPRAWGGAAAYDGRIYLVGGNSAGRFIEDVLVYDTGRRGELDTASTGRVLASWARIRAE